MSESIRIPRLLLALCLGALLALTGCPNGEEGGENGNGNGNGDPCAGVTCGPCQICDDDGNCVADPQAECATDADCGSDILECRDCMCVEKCEGVGCNPGYECEPTTGECVPVEEDECQVDADCNAANFEVCVDGECQGTTRSVCSDVPCADGLDCLHVYEEPTCWEPCSASSDCGDLTFFCTQVDTYGTYCDQNLCGTDPIFGQVGYTTVSHWGGKCDVDGVGDGTCLGPIGAQQVQFGMLEIGLCFADGQAGPGEACHADALHGDAQACEGGLCNAAEGEAGACLEFCTLTEGTECQAIDGQSQACEWIGIGRGGICWPQTADPSDSLEPCTPQSETNPAVDCVTDHVCADVGGGSAICNPWCDLLAPDCPDGLTCFGIDPEEQLLGICATQ